MNKVDNRILEDFGGLCTGLSLSSCLRPSLMLTYMFDLHRSRYRSKIMNLSVRSLPQYASTSRGVLQHDCFEATQLDGSYIIRIHLGSQKFAVLNLEKLPKLLDIATFTWLKDLSKMHPMPTISF